MNSTLYTKSLLFAERILGLSEYVLNKRQYVYAKEVCVKQITRSGTSIGANIAEGSEAQSNADLLTKYCIALKEARETCYWLDLLLRKNYITQQIFDSMYKDLDEIIKILITSIKSIKNKK